MSELVLLPVPQQITVSDGALALADGKLIALAVDNPAELRFTAGCWQQALAAETGLRWEMAGGAALPAEQIGLLIAYDSALKSQGYHLRITADGITLAARDAAGAFYGVMTLCQIVQQRRAHLPLLTINDWPDLPNRGLMLDISRDKVPTMATLYMLVDRLASWKMNEFQLYTEHTFAYRQHPTVWAKASPMTAEEILALDAYCRERFINLVPNQNSFGHLHRWFEHPQYLPLAETEEGIVTPWGSKQDFPFSLTPANPDSLIFLEGLYAELLPNFTSRFFNVGCDETFDLGQGRSKALCAEKGEGRVYLDFLLEIHKRVRAHGRTMMFWGDIIGNHPHLVSELPQDVVALEWGYEADHDFDGKCRAFAASGIPFYVCPGTSSWTTIAGRTDNALANIRNAVENGLRHGAIGVLNTDWGDLGHWQPLPVSWLGYAYGAALGWAFQANADADIRPALDAFAFGDKNGVMGRLAYDLGNAYQQPGALIPNGSLLFWAYHWPLDVFNHPDQHLFQNALAQSVDDLPGKLRATLAYIDEVMAPLGQAQMLRDDAELMAQEMRMAADLLRHGAKRLLLMTGDRSFSRAELAAELAALIERYQAQWLARNRPGGLAESVARLKTTLASYH